MAKRRYFGNLFERPGRKGIYIRFRYGGRRYCRLAGLTKTDAENYALELARKIKSGQFEEEERERKEIEFEAFAKKHLKLLKAEHAKTTYQNERARIRSVLIPRFRGRLLSDISFEQLEKFILKLAEEGKSPATRNRYIVLFSRLFERAKAYGYVETNPARDLKRLREEERAVPALSVEEQNALIEACDAKVKDIVLVALDTGCRKMELLRLEWKDVDLTLRELTVQKSKSGKSRIVPVTDRAAARLQVLRDNRVIPMEGPDRVFADIAPSWPASTRLLVKKAAVSIGHPELTFHDLRHLCAVNLVRSGVPLPDVGRWLGHSPNSITVTMRYARHAPKDASQAARSLLEARIAAG